MNLALTIDKREFSRCKVNLHLLTWKTMECINCAFSKCLLLFSVVFINKQLNRSEAYIEWWTKPVQFRLFDHVLMQIYCATEVFVLLDNEVSIKICVPCRALLGYFLVIIKHSSYGISTYPNCQSNLSIAHPSRCKGYDADSRMFWNQDFLPYLVLT